MLPRGAWLERNGRSLLQYPNLQRNAEMDLIKRQCPWMRKGSFFEDPGKDMRLSYAIFISLDS